jgi:hypothetical protein
MEGDKHERKKCRCYVQCGTQTLSLCQNLLTAAFRHLWDLFLASLWVNFLDLRGDVRMSFGTAAFNPYPTAFPYGNGMVLHFHQQQESSTTKTVHKGINKGLKTYV